MGSNQSGIYKITIHDKEYIGSAINFRKRWNEHREDLKKNTHHSIFLQRAWNKYQCAVFEIICVCPSSCLLGMEQYYIDKLKPTYNMHLTAGSPLGVKRSEQFKINQSERMKGNQCALGHKHTEETLQLMREKHLGHPGVIHSEETRRKQSEIRKAYWLNKKLEKAI